MTGLFLSKILPKKYVLYNISTKVLSRHSTTDFCESCLPLNVLTEFRESNVCIYIAFRLLLP